MQPGIAKDKDGFFVDRAKGKIIAARESLKIYGESVRILNCRIYIELIENNRNYRYLTRKFVLFNKIKGKVLVFNETLSVKNLIERVKSRNRSFFCVLKI